MEQTGWTERGLHEEVSLGTILRMNYLNEMRAKVSKVKDRKQGALSHGGSVTEVEFYV